MLTAINNAMVINKNVSKFLVLFAGTVFVKVVFVLSIISLHVTTESSIILPKYLPCLELHFAGFQIYFFSHT